MAPRSIPDEPPAAEHNVGRHAVKSRSIRGARQLAGLVEPRTAARPPSWLRRNRPVRASNRPCGRSLVIRLAVQHGSSGPLPRVEGGAPGHLRLRRRSQHGAQPGDRVTEGVVGGRGDGPNDSRSYLILGPPADYRTPASGTSNASLAVVHGTGFERASTRQHEVSRYRRERTNLLRAFRPHSQRGSGCT